MGSHYELLGTDREKTKKNYYEMKTGTCLLHHVGVGGLISVFLLKAHQYITPCPLKHQKKGKGKEKDKENVILNIAPSSFLKCDSVYNHIQLS